MQRTTMGLAGVIEFNTEPWARSSNSPRAGQFVLNVPEPITKVTVNRPAVIVA